MFHVGAEFAFIGLTFLLAGFVKGVVGLGLPTVAVGLLELVHRPCEAAALLVAPSMVTNTSCSCSGGPRFGQLLLAAVADAGRPSAPARGALRRAGAGQDDGPRHQRARRGADRLCRDGPRRRAAGGAAPGGTLDGAAGRAGYGGDHRRDRGLRHSAVPYLQGLGLDKESMVQALGLSFTVSTIALAVSLALGGALLHTPVLGASLLALVPALGGCSSASGCGTGSARTLPAPVLRRIAVAGGGLALRGIV